MIGAASLRRASSNPSIRRKLRRRQLPKLRRSSNRPKSPRRAKSGRQGPAAEPPPPEINFVTFVVSLSTQALMHLGEIPDPMTNQRERDLGAAQHIIDILGMLQDKTRGNLDHDEESLLRSILFDLRMKYVESARHPG